MLLAVHSEPTLFHFADFSGIHFVVWILLLDSYGLTQCCGCSFKQNRKRLIWLFEYIFYCFGFFFLFCHVYCAFFKCNIPKIFVLTSGPIIFFLFPLLLLTMFYKKPSCYAPLKGWNFSLKCSLIWTWQLFETSQAGDVVCRNPPGYNPVLVPEFQRSGSADCAGGWNVWLGFFACFGFWGKLKFVFLLLLFVTGNFII